MHVDYSYIGTGCFFDNVISGKRLVAAEDLKTTTPLGVFHLQEKDYANAPVFERVGIAAGTQSAAFKLFQGTTTAPTDGSGAGIIFGTHQDGTALNNGLGYIGAKRSSGGGVGSGYDDYGT